MIFAYSYALLIFSLELLDPVAGPPVNQCIVQSTVFRGTDKSPCDEGECRSLSDVAISVLDQDERKELYGAANKADLILSRGGIFDFDQRNLANTHLCQKHEDEYGPKKWKESRKNRPLKDNAKLKCNMPSWPGLKPHGVVSAAKNIFLFKEQLWLCHKNNLEQ